MAATAESIQSGSITIVAADGVTIDITISSVTTSRSIVMYTMRGAITEERLKRHIFNASLTSSTNLRLVRHESGFAKTVIVEWTVVEYDAGVLTSLQTGIADRTAALHDVSISAVVLARTFPILDLKTSVNGLTDTITFRGHFTSTTNLRLENKVAPTTGQSVAGYQIVEFATGADIGIEAGVVTIPPDVESATATIPAIDLSKSFIINAGANGVSSNPSWNRGIARLKFTSSTVVEADRSLLGVITKEIDVQFYVVELKDSGQAVESFDASITDTNTAPATQPSWTALSTTKTAIMSGWPFSNARGDNDTDDLPQDRIASIVLDAGADGATITRTGVDGLLALTGYAVDWTAAGGTTTPQAIAVTAVGVAGVSTVIILAQAIPATAVGVASITKLVKKNLAATAIGVVAITKLVKKPIAATAVGVASMTKLVKKPLAATAVGVAAVATALNFKRTLAATALGAASLATAPRFGQTIAATAVAVASLGTSFIAGVGAGARILKRVLRRVLRPVLRRIRREDDP